MNTEGRGRGAQEESSGPSGNLGKRRNLGREASLPHKQTRSLSLLESQKDPAICPLNGKINKIKSITRSRVHLSYL